MKLTIQKAWCTSSSLPQLPRPCQTYQFTFHEFRSGPSCAPHQLRSKTSQIPMTTLWMPLSFLLATYNQRCWALLSICWWLLVFNCFLHRLSCWCCCQRTLCYSLKDFSDLLHLHCMLTPFWNQGTVYRASLTTVYHQSSCLGSKGPKPIARNRTQDPSDLGAFLPGAQGGLPLSLLRYHANCSLDQKGLQSSQLHRVKCWWCHVHTL